MKINSIKRIKSGSSSKAISSFVDSGYVKVERAQMPDVDVDYQSDKRQEIKEYYETRYNHNGKQRVFSAGTFTTLKLKAVIKDVARTMRISPSLVNYFTAILEDDKMDYTDLFQLATQNKKVAKFIQDYPMLFEDIRTLMNQPRSSSIHASALLVTPDTMDGQEMECFDYVPIKKVDGVLVSEDDGYSLDELGLLKNDCLATKELSKLHETIDLVNENYNENVDMKEIVRGEMDDPKVYELLKQGFTQNVFQFSSVGMTKFLTSMRPSNINDLIAANALFRPATLDSGSANEYVDCKNGYVTPTYLWGTHNALKDTYACLAYQEQCVQIAREVGGFSLGEGVKLVKFISKKKQDKINAMKSKFMKGAAEKGCPEVDAVSIWEMFEAAGSYLFNKSHATAYAATAYVGAWLKANYPTAFYTVALQWADDKEILPIMSEMQACSIAKVVHPDINSSGADFYTNYETNEIFWSLSKIKMLGVKAVEWIVNERDKNGKFSSIQNFIERVFKYKLKKYEYWDDPDNEDEATRCPVNARHVLNLILSGCFDKIENIEGIEGRYGIIKKAAELLGFEVDTKDFPVEFVDKQYFWSQKQIKISGLGSIDYKRIYDGSDIKLSLKGRGTYREVKDIANPDFDGTKAIVCATIAEIEEKRFTSKKTGTEETFAKITLQQNNDMTTLVIWGSEWEDCRIKVAGNQNKILICLAKVKYSQFSGKNELQLTRTTLIDVM